MTVDRNLLRQQNISTVLISLALIGCIAILLFVTYTSQSRIQDFALDQLRQDTEKRAGAVRYFFQERRSDLESLAEQRALSTFFENEALGMSMRYGLRDSLLAVGEGGISFDITEHKRVEAEKEVLEGQLRQATEDGSGRHSGRRHRP